LKEESKNVIIQRYQNMKLIVGLGNPGAKYKNNRHNIGFMVADIFAIEEGLSWKYSRDWMCHFAKTRHYIIIKPSTYMNSSGESGRAVCDYFSIESDDVLIIHDELDLAFGKIRLSFDGSSAGHHGVESVNKGLGTSDFARLRVGIGKPSIEEATKFVLQDFSEDEKKGLPEIIAKCEEAIKSYLDDGLEATMNRFN
jgi:PTH1 family peptidyl-tRNA hydrolase